MLKLVDRKIACSHIYFSCLS